MIRKLAEHRIAFLLVAVLLLIQSFSADLSDPYKKPIAGDAQGYYAYLPAIFIYHDLDYTFIPAVEQTYYAPGYSKSFVKEINGEKVNKTFPGVTVLYLPFFLMAHGISLLSGLPADGYAYTYQLFYMIGFWFYALMGMVFFKKVLVKLDFSARQADIALLVCVLGTNIYFYTLYDTSVTHIYNFFLVNLAIYLLLGLKAGMEIKKLLILFTTLAIIGITRPTNFLVLFIIPFFIPEKVFYQRFFSHLFRFKNVFLALIVSVPILSIPLILWKLQTGNWIVYSYGEEGFDFAHPEWFNFLFSYTKGWFLYTPVALIVIVAGLVLLFRTDRPRALTAMLFYVLSVYLFSSWWCWYYGAGMSQRVMIDYTILPGFFIALIVQFLQDRKSVRFIAATACAALVSLNVAQAWQISKGILPMGSPTKEQYWDNFLVFHKRARVYAQDHWQQIETRKIALDPAAHFVIKDKSYLTGSDWTIQVSDTNEYSAVVHIPTQPVEKGSKLVLSFEVLASTGVEKTRLVFVLPSGETFVYYLKAYAEAGEWTLMEFLAEPVSSWSGGFDIYFWNAGSTEIVAFRNLEFTHFYSEDYF